MTFPIKKRITTNLFIDEKQGLYLQKGGRKLSGKIEETKMYWRENKGGNENRKWLPVWNDLLAGRKDKPMAAYLKRLGTLQK